MTGAQNDDHQFRRGVVLGLTFAEILLLLIFLLMLILGAKMISLHHELDRSRADQAIAKQEIVALRPLFAKLARPEGEHFDIAKEWVRLNERLNRAELVLAEDREVVSLVGERQRTEPGRTPLQVSREVADDARLGRRFVSDAHSLSPQMSQTDAVNAYETAANVGKYLGDKSVPTRTLVQDDATCHAKLSTCKAQNTNLSARLGGTLPPCWVDENGKTQYIFDARLRESGIWLSDNHIVGREADQRSLPASGFSFGTPIEVGSFVAAGQPLIQYSDRNACRFYVRVFDETGAESKARYKQLLQGVEGVFYKLLMK